VEYSEVNVAFEILLEEVEVATNALQESGAELLRCGDFVGARDAIAEVEKLTDFHQRIKDLQVDWATLSSVKDRSKTSATRRSVDRRLSKGLRTPEDAFRMPILEALIELGGSASIAKVLDKVEDKMRGKLNDYDLQPLASDPRSIRWRNTAQWCRNTLVKEGLMRSDSRTGVWEISDRGMRELNCR